MATRESYAEPAATNFTAVLSPGPLNGVTESAGTRQLAVAMGYPGPPFLLVNDTIALE